MKDSKIKPLAQNKIRYSNNAHWVFYKNMIIVEPINDLLKGIIFNKSGLVKTQFELKYFVQSLYVPTDVLNLSFGGTIKTPNNRQWWDFDGLSIEDLGKQIHPFVNQVNMSFFKIRKR